MELLPILFQIGRSEAGNILDHYPFVVEVYIGDLTHHWQANAFNCQWCVLNICVAQWEHPCNCFMATFMVETAQWRPFLIGCICSLNLCLTCFNSELACSLLQSQIGLACNLYALHITACHQPQSFKKPTPTPTLQPLSHTASLHYAHLRLPRYMTVRSFFCPCIKVWKAICTSAHLHCHTCSGCMSWSRYPTKATRAFRWGYSPRDLASHSMMRSLMVSTISCWLCVMSTR